ncbi:MAG: hypothetical protein ACO331_09670 [Prochlorothrix sp.]
MSKGLAIGLGGVGVALAALPWVFPDVVLGLLPGQPEAMPPWVYGAAGALGAGLLWQGWQTWRKSRSRQPQSDAKSIVAAVLLPLENQGWTVKYSGGGSKAGKTGKGSKTVAPSLEALVSSPKGQHFLISVKSHRGKVGSEGDQIFRVYDQSQRPFETDLLAQTRQRAAGLKAKLGEVTPILVFPEALVEIKENPVGGVYVAGRTTLRACLLQKTKA